MPTLPNFMKFVDIILQRDELGNTVPVKNVTPAELMLLVGDSYPLCNGKNPVIKMIPVMERKRGEVQDRDSAFQPMFKDDPEAENGKGKPILVRGWIETDKEREENRTPQFEVKRLASKYGGEKVKRAFGNGPIPQLPQTFDEAIQYGMGLHLGGERFGGFHGNVNAAWDNA